ncbi:TPA: LysR family transcriptional regulator [Klebsiella pneumoniae]|nr:LysR family transcriptional regulator [Klebsiella pneumoniae]
MNTSIPWEWYRTFLAVLQEGSLSGASRTLNITQPTAGRHIAGLETALGQALFTRSQTGLLATDAALALRVHAEAMDNTARALERTAANFSRDRADLRGVVRVAASEVVGAEVLPPLVARLRQAYPRFQREAFAMRTDSDLAQLSLIRAGAGIGICQVPLADGIIPLQRVLAADFSLYLDTWLVMHEDLRHSPACKRVFDFLAQGLQAYIRGPLAS